MSNTASRGRDDHRSHLSTRSRARLHVTHHTDVLSFVCPDVVSAANAWRRRSVGNGHARGARAHAGTTSQPVSHRSRTACRSVHGETKAMSRRTRHAAPVTTLVTDARTDGRHRPVVLVSCKQKPEAQLRGVKRRHRETPCRPSKQNHLFDRQRVTLRLPLGVATLSGARCGSRCPRWTRPRAGSPMSTTTTTHPTTDASSTTPRRTEGPADA
jgi:hypothetical protein